MKQNYSFHTWFCNVQSFLEFEIVAMWLQTCLVSKSKQRVKWVQMLAYKHAALTKFIHPASQVTEGDAPQHLAPRATVGGTTSSMKTLRTWCTVLMVSAAGRTNGLEKKLYWTRLNRFLQPYYAYTYVAYSIRGNLVEISSQVLSTLRKSLPFKE